MSEWRVGSNYLTESGDVVEIFQINENTLTIECQGTYFAYNLKGDPIGNHCPWGKLMKLLSGSDSFERGRECPQPTQ